MKKIFILFFIFLFIGQASAGQWSTNGTTYDTTWDGRVIPSDQIVYGSNDDTIFVQSLSAATAFTVGNDTIYINNNFISFNREKFKISPVLTYSKTILLSKMVSVNATVGYLVFPYSLSRVKDYISDNEIRMGNWTFRAGQEHIDIYDDNQTTVNGSQNVLNKSAYTFRIVNDEIRLYFLKSEANKLQGNITFEMNSWTINGSTTSGWQNTSLFNTTINQGTTNIELKKINEGLSYWRFDGNAKDDNITSANDGTLTGTTLVTGKYGSAYQFDGSSDIITVSSSSTIENLTGTFTIAAWVKPNTSQGVYSAIFSKGSWRLYFGINTNRQLVYWMNNGRQETGALSLTANEWSHIAWVHTGNATNEDRFYINGVFDSHSSSGAYQNYTKETGNIGLGKMLTGANGCACTIDEIYLFNYSLTNEQINQTMNNTAVQNGYIKSWYNSAPNETYQIDVNGTNQTNSNVSLQYVQNGSTPTDFYGTQNSSLNASWSLSPRFTNTDIYLWLFGNGTSTPQVSNITFYDQAASGGELSCGLNTLTNVTVFANGTAINCNPTNGTAAITMSYKFQQNASNDYYVFNMTTATSSSRIFNESSNNASLGIQILQGGLGNNLNHTVKIYNATNQTTQFWIKSNSTGWLEYNTSKFSTPRYTVITAENPGAPIIIYGGLAVVVISGLAYILRRVTKI